METVVNLFWFRRDLRLNDQAALYHALRSGNPVVPVFIFDRNILDELEDRQDRRVEFIHHSLSQIQQQLKKTGSTLDVRYGFPTEIFQQLIRDYRIGKVFANHDYEPYARGRDAEVEQLLRRNGITFHSFKDQVIFEKNEVSKDDGSPYTVFTPYASKWKKQLISAGLSSYPAEKHLDGFYQQTPKKIPFLEEMNFQPSGKAFPVKKWDREIIKKYREQRDYPAIEGTSRLSVHLRFGTISIRELAREAATLNETFLNELIWRDFYQMILWHFPRVMSEAFKPAYDQIGWRNDEKDFEHWCTGHTGYPIVDAGMRELNKTGYMHNRVRMITASFLTKHLLIDWRWGEAYFAKKLLDYDMAANNGGWQWAAGSGCDAAPYFRIFNPYLQTKKFDPGQDYIRRWVPDLNEKTYPPPMVDHRFARERCLQVYKKAITGVKN